MDLLILCGNCCYSFIVWVKCVRLSGINCLSMKFVMIKIVNVFVFLLIGLIMVFCGFYGIIIGKLFWVFLD